MYLVIKFFKWKYWNPASLFFERSWEFMKRVAQNWSEWLVHGSKYLHTVILFEMTLRVKDFYFWVNQVSNNIDMIGNKHYATQRTSLSALCQCIYIRISVRTSSELNSLSRKLTHRTITFIFIVSNPFNNSKCCYFSIFLITGSLCQLDGKFLCY